MLIPLVAAPSPALSVLLGSLLLVAAGLRGMLLPQAGLRRLLSGGDPAGLGMCAFALGLAAIGLLLVVLALGGQLPPATGDTRSASAWFVAGCGTVLLVAAADLLRTALGFRRVPMFARPALVHARLAMALLARR